MASRNPPSHTRRLAPALSAVALLLVGGGVLAAVPGRPAALPPLNVRTVATAVRAADLALGAFESCLDGARDELAGSVDASSLADVVRAEGRFRSCLSNDRTVAVATTARVHSTLAGSSARGPAGRILTRADTSGRLAMVKAGVVTATFTRILSNLRGYLTTARTRSASGTLLRALLADDETVAVALEGLQAANVALADADVTLSALPAAVSARP